MKRLSKKIFEKVEDIKSCSNDMSWAFSSDLKNNSMQDEDWDQITLWIDGLKNKVKSLDKFIKKAVENQAADSM